MLKTKGFSLVELLVVVAIIGVLAAVGTIAYNGYVDGARKAAAQNAMQQIALMQTEYYSITGGYYGVSDCSPSATGTSEINKKLFDTEGDEKVIDVERYEFCVQEEKEDSVVVGFVVKAQAEAPPSCEVDDKCPKVFTLNSKGENNF